MLPVVDVEVGGAVTTLQFDTGWFGLTLESGARVDLPDAGSPTHSARKWGKPISVLDLAPVRVRLGGRTGVVPRPTRLTTADPFAQQLGIQGTFGQDLLGVLGSVLSYKGGGQACVTGPPCVGSPPKVWTEGAAAGRPARVLVDSGTKSAILMQDVPPEFTLPGGRVVSAPLQSPARVESVYGGGRLGGDRVDAILGWDALKSFAWTIDVCDGTFRASPSSPG